MKVFTVTVTVKAATEEIEEEQAKIFFSQMVMSISSDSVIIHESVKAAVMETNNFES